MNYKKIVVILLIVINLTVVIYQKQKYDELNNILIEHQIVEYSPSKLLITKNLIKKMQDQLNEKIELYNNKLLSIQPFIDIYSIELDEALNPVEQYQLTIEMINQKQIEKLGNISDVPTGKTILETEKTIYNETLKFYEEINIEEKIIYLNDKKCENIIVNEILIVNKLYCLEENFDPGLNQKAKEELDRMFDDASLSGYNLKTTSEYRNYNDQEEIYTLCLEQNGSEIANKMCALPGYSEHQTGLAFDIGCLECDNISFGDTKDSVWLKENAHNYGFIIRYNDKKTNITGYNYEPWHIRYVGDIAKKLYEENLMLEEYLYQYLEETVILE